MTVFTFPPPAAEETGCFSVLDGTQKEELMIVPYGAALTEDFDGIVWFMDQAAPVTLPISQKTIVPEALAEQFPENPVFVSSQIIEGALEEYLRTKKGLYQARLWLILEPYRHAMTLPCPSGVLQQETVPPDLPDFFSEAFCCRYRIDENSAKVYLFDTPDTISEKRALAERIGIGQMLILP